MKYWRITLLGEEEWNGRQWTYSGVPAVSRVLEFGNSPKRDKKARLACIKELCEAGANFEVRYYD